MNECAFKNIAIGERVTIDFTNKANCMTCNQSLVGMSVEGIYRGHVTDNVVYDLVTDIDFYCPNCNNLLHTYANICRKGGIWVISEKYVEETV